MNNRAGDKIELVASFAGDGFLLAAKHLSKVVDEHPELFETIVELLGIDRRDAYFMARVDRAFRNLAIDENHMASIGWPKLIVLCDHISSNNHKRLLELADKTPAKELAKLLPQQRAGRKRMVLYLTDKEYRVLEQAILSHGGVQDTRGGLAGKEEALTKALSAKPA